jgi:enoyl-CoA hydratase/carnithine racemase
MTARLERDGPIAVLVLDRPGRANAYDRAMLEALERGLDDALADTDMRALVIEAAGEGAFCGGADLAQMKQAEPADALDLYSQAVFDRIARAPLVSVAAVHGAAVAGGFELALACDLRVASPTARFSLPETALGLIPSAGGCTRLTRLVGPSRAKQLILAGLDLDARTAMDWGLLAGLVPEPRQEARALARRIAQRDPVALRLAKQVIDHADDRASLEAERVAEALLYARKGT